MKNPLRRIVENPAGIRRAGRRGSRRRACLSSAVADTGMVMALMLAYMGCAEAAAPGPKAKKTGNVIYVDQQIATDSSKNYNVANRNAGGGTAMVYRTLGGAAEVAVAGQTVLIREGTYAEPLVPANSGRPGQYITFRNFGKERVVISKPGLRPAINLSNRSYVIIEGLEFSKVHRWLYALNAHHNILHRNRFLKALCPGGSSKTGLFFQKATYNRIIRNAIEETTQDNLALIRSDRNLVEGNTFRKAKHTLWTIKGGNFNVFRGNHFLNEWQKIGEVFDCDRVGFKHEFTMKDCTKYNLIESNTFAYTPSSGRHSPYAGIQYAGQNGIIRRNVFHSTVGPALSMTLYGKEANHNTDNRVYGNVLFGSDFAGITLSGSTRYAFSGNLFRNNILAGSMFVANDTRWSWYTKELAGKPVQLFTGRTSGFLFERNVLHAAKGDRRYVITRGSRTSKSNPAQHELAWWQEEHPALFKKNLEADPQFVDPGKRDFRLKKGSALIDAGAFLTKTTRAGKGTKMPVQDVGWFFDGFEIPGQKGDLVQLEGQQATARVKDIDYENKVLILDKPLTWRAEQGVALPYTGTRPDIGVHENPPTGHETQLPVAVIPPRLTTPVQRESGIKTSGLTKVELIRVGDKWEYFKGRAAPPPTWNSLTFDASKWLRGPTGIGYSSDIKLTTRLNDMLGKYVSVYARRKFKLAKPVSVARLTLGMVYDDGFVAYINGTEVARSAGMGAPGTPVKFNAVAKSSHDEEAPEEQFVIKLRPGLLRPGENVLAVQVHNVYLKSSDLALIPRLFAEVKRTDAP